MKTKTRKRSSPEVEVIFPRNQVKTTKKDFFATIFEAVTIFGRKFVESFNPAWLFFLWSSSAQLSVGGRLNLDGGDAKSRWGDANSQWGDASPLQFKYWLAYR